MAMENKPIARITALPAAMAMLLLVDTGCSLVNDDPRDCPASLRVKFAYDYNIKFADAFANEVGSINLWVFDREGKPVWNGEASGDMLRSPEFTIEVPLGEGEYDFVAWCGLKDNPGFKPDTYSPDRMEDLAVKLITHEADGYADVSDSRLGSLYHGYVKSVDYRIDPYAPTDRLVCIPLVKDTNEIRVMLQNLNGKEMDSSDFSCHMEIADAFLEWDNLLSAPSPQVRYLPWLTRYGITDTPTSPVAGRATVTSVASLLYDFSTSRLTVERPATLTVRRNTDGHDIIRINLTDFLLMVKGHYGDMSDSEYLDRQDDYSVVFFIDDNSDWYQAAGIYINNWAVVPPQEEGI